MSTIHTEASHSVPGSEVEPSASGAYDYSESINDNDEKLDEGLRAPIPIHDDDLDTSLLSDNELEAFVKTKQYTGKAGSIPGNLSYIYQRLSGHSKWDPKVYKQSQPPPSSKSKKAHFSSEVSTMTRAETTSFDNAIPHDHEQSYSEMEVHPLPHSQPEPTPFGVATLTPAVSMINASVSGMESIDRFTEDADPLHFINTKHHKQTIPESPDPTSPSLSTNNTLALRLNGSINSVAFKMERTQSEQSEQKEKSKEEKGDKQMKSEKQPVAECTMKEMMQHVANLTSEVINLQQSVYVKDIMIKNLYLRLKEMDHLSFPRLLIERVHIVANYNNKHKFSHKSNRYGSASSANDRRPKYNKRTTLSEDDSMDSTGTGYQRYSHNGYVYGKHHGQNGDRSNLMKHTSTVTLEVITRWMPRHNLPSARKKGLVFLKEEDICDDDDYLTHQMWNEWTEKGKKYSMNGLDKLRREEAQKQLTGYMQHERVGLVRIEILRGKKYKKYKRIEKKFESLIMPITELPKGDTYHIMIKVHNPSASLWGPLSNMVSIKVPLRFVDDNDSATDNETANSKDGARKSKKTSTNKGRR